MSVNLSLVTFRCMEVLITVDPQINHGKSDHTTHRYGYQNDRKCMC